MIFSFLALVKPPISLSDWLLYINLLALNLFRRVAVILDREFPVFYRKRHTFAEQWLVLFYYIIINIPLLIDTM